MKLLSVLFVFGAMSLSAAQLKWATLRNVPLISKEGVAIPLGGLSGLDYLGKDPKGNWTFLTLTDRGPNGDDVVRDGVSFRTFSVPEFQPQILELSWSPKTQELRITKQVPMTKDGKGFTGLPGAGLTREVGVDSQGEKLSPNPNGIDPEGIKKASDGNYWVVEEYGPSILEFGTDGVLKNRYVPEGANALGMEGIEVLPKHYLKRQVNRGFEGLAIIGKKLYAAIQSPLELPFPNMGSFVPVVEFDLTTRKVTGEYFYRFETEKSDKLGDLAATAKGNLLFIEQNSKTGPDSLHRVYEVSLKDATNVYDPLHPWAEKKELELAQVRVLEKHLAVDLVKAGIDSLEKIEGLTLLGSRHLAISNDNDFKPGQDSRMVLIPFMTRAN